MQSSAILRYGSYEFIPVPQVGVRKDYERQGGKTGPALSTATITLVGRLKGDNDSEVNLALANLQAALAKDHQTLYYKDSAGFERYNIEANLISFDAPASWHQYELRYTITLQTVPFLDEVRSAKIIAKYVSTGGTYQWTTALAANQFTPYFGRDFSVEYDGDGNRGVTKVQVSIVAAIEKGTWEANKTEFDALCAALSKNGTLYYGSFQQDVRVKTWNQAGIDIHDRRIGPYTVTFEYDIGTAGPYAGVTKFQSVRRVTRVHQRQAWHSVPFLDSDSVQLLGEAGQLITVTGFAEADTIAHAYAAGVAEIAALIPAGGYEQDGSDVQEDANKKRVEWNVTHRYMSPALRGGIYG